MTLDAMIEQLEDLRNRHGGSIEVLTWPRRRGKYERRLNGDGETQAGEPDLHVRAHPATEAELTTGAAKVVMIEAL